VGGSESFELGMEWFVEEAKKLHLGDHPAGLQSEKPGPGTAGTGKV
jgi:hypothetical protein